MIWKKSCYLTVGSDGNDVSICFEAGVLFPFENPLFTYVTNTAEQWLYGEWSLDL